MKASLFSPVALSLAVSSLALGVAAPATAEVVVSGGWDLTFRWAPTPNPSLGYAVYVSHDGGPFQTHSFVMGGPTEQTLATPDGGLVQVQIAGVFPRAGGGFVLGPLSDASFPYRFFHQSQPPLPYMGPGVAHDFNRDGRADLLFRDVATGDLIVWQMNGPEIEIEYGLAGGNGSGFPLITAGDFNGDAFTDVVWRHHSSGTLLLYQPHAGIGTFTPGNLTTVILAGDFNGDDTTDLLTWQWLAPWVVNWLIDGPILLQQKPFSMVSPTWKFNGAGDFDGDGTDDIVFREPQGEVTIGRVINGIPATYTEIGTMPIDWKLADVGDLDADGLADLVFRHPDGRVHVWLVAGTYVAAQGDPGTPGDDWTFLALRDVDGDGTSDMVWRRDDGQVRIWLMDGLSPFEQADVAMLKPGLALAVPHWL